jgi:hypothetical protein
MRRQGVSADDEVVNLFVAKALQNLDEMRIHRVPVR